MSGSKRNEVIPMYFLPIFGKYVYLHFDIEYILHLKRDFLPIFITYQLTSLRASFTLMFLMMDFAATSPSFPTRYLSATTAS